MAIKLSEQFLKASNNSALNTSYQGASNNSGTSDAKNDNESIFSHFEHSLCNSENFETGESKYNKNGQLTSQIYTNDDDIYEIRYQYDRWDELCGVHIVAYNSDSIKTGDDTMSIDKSGNVTEYETCEYDENGKVASRQKIEFDDDGNVVSDETYEIDRENTEFNGLIENSQQGNELNDCWLLSGLNALSCSELGEKMIKESIKQNDDGSYNVYFKGLDYTVTITQDDITNAEKSKKYSSGDSDVMLMELACEKALEETKEARTNGGIYDSNDLSFCALDESVKRNNQLDYRNFSSLIYMLDGKKIYTNSNEVSPINSVLDEIEKDKDSRAICFSFKDKTDICDVNGNTFKVYKDHAYSIKSVDGDNVTIINPHDSSIEYVVDRETLNSMVKDWSGYYLRKPEETQIDLYMV